jgi:gliding motility-associated lipoprotein GldH
MTASLKNTKWFFLLLCLIWLGCDPNKVYEDYQEIPDGVWNIDQPVSFQVDIDDTTKGNNIIVEIRHTPSYPFQNLYLFLHTTYPDGEKSKDSLMFYLMEPSGKPLGDCAGDLCDARFLFRENVHFPLRGPYTFELMHTMRVANGLLPGILDIGFRIEHYSTPKP